MPCPRASAVGASDEAMALRAQEDRIRVGGVHGKRAEDRVVVGAIWSRRPRDDGGVVWDRSVARALRFSAPRTVNTRFIVAPIDWRGFGLVVVAWLRSGHRSRLLIVHVVRRDRGGRRRGLRLTRLSRRRWRCARYVIGRWRCRSFGRRCILTRRRCSHRWGGAGRRCGSTAHNAHGHGQGENGSGGPGAKRHVPSVESGGTSGNVANTQSGCVDQSKWW